jgi:dTDP-4-dehydrorhamnose 3,5-epimerase
MINGVSVRKLMVFENELGGVKHMLKKQWPEFNSFGEVYFSTINAGIIKGWKRHDKTVLNYTVPVGNVKVVIYDGDKKSPTYCEIQEIELGESNHVLLTIPANVWYSFASLNDEKAIICNLISVEHSEDEHHQIELVNDKIPYKWLK